MIKLIPIALSLSFVSFAGCSESAQDVKTPSAVRETEPLAFRIDGMKRVNGAL